MATILNSRQNAITGEKLFEIRTGSTLPEGRYTDTEIFEKPDSLNIKNDGSGCCEGGIPGMMMHTKPDYYCIIAVFADRDDKEKDYYKAVPVKSNPDKIKAYLNITDDSLPKPLTILDLSSLNNPKYKHKAPGSGKGIDCGAERKAKKTIGKSCINCIE